MTLVTIRCGSPRPYPPGIAAFVGGFRHDRADRRRIETRNKASGRLAFPPTLRCPFSGAPAVACVEPSGRDTRGSRKIVRAAPGAFAQLAPYRMCIVASNEGGRGAGALISNRDPQIDAQIDAGFEATALLYNDRSQMGLVQ